MKIRRFSTYTSPYLRKGELSLQDGKCMDWKLENDGQVDMAYKAGGKCEFWTQTFMHIT